ncbi:MAG: hypothetical protein ED559_05695 [Phycisphaera sp.]|nr:MAG: hypothetical protein ED559_05695 [Phycisphaera sp.]
MIVVVSPYHMTSREPAAMVSMVLARNIVTAMPTPAGSLSKESVSEAASRVPRYVELMESWDWASPMFAGGICGTSFAGEDPLDEVLGVCDDIEQDDLYAPLRPFMRTVLEQESDTVISAISRDVIKAGPDPSISVPLTAAIDRFASRHGLIAVRSESKSAAQKAEQKLARPLVKFAFETILQAPSNRLLEMRTTFEVELDRLREALDAEDESAARVAADLLTQSFEREREDLLRVEDPDDVRAVSGLVSLTLAELPEDAVLLSSAAAATRVLGRQGESAFSSAGPVGTVRSLTIRPIGGRTPRC